MPTVVIDLVAGGTGIVACAATIDIILAVAPRAAVVATPRDRVLSLDIDQKIHCWDYV